MTRIHSLCTTMLVGVVLVACGDDSGEGGAGGGGTSSSSAKATSASSGGTKTTSTTASASTSPASSSTGNAATGRVRVAHLSPGTPAVDVCASGDGGTTWIGPVLKSLGDTDGLAYPEVTGYVEVPATTLDFRIVAPNAADCNTALANLPDVEGVVVEAGKDYTAAAIGALIEPGPNDEAFKVALLADDNTAPAAGKVHLRFVHASPDTPNVDVGLGSGANFTAVWTNVAFGEVGSVGGGNYVPVDAPTNATVSARATGTTTDALVLNGLTIPAGTIVTAFAIGNLDGTPSPLKVRACFDNAATPTCLTLP